MGIDRAFLNVGPLMFTWEETVPYFLTFLFSESDLYPKEDDPERDWALEGAGYKTTCGQAKHVMQLYGYDMNFALQIYDALHSDAELQADESLRYHFAERSGKEAADPSISKQLETYTTGERRRTEELSEFVAFIKSIADQGPLSSAFSAPHQVHFDCGFR